MGKLIEANQEEFKQIIESEEGVVLVDFWAQWCGPCVTLGPVLKEVSEEVENITIVKVNVDENAELSAEYGVRSIPVVFAIKDGETVDKFVGVRKKDEVIEFIEKNSEVESVEETKENETKD